MSFQSVLPKQIRLLITEFNKLPGIGPKSAERLVFYLLKSKHADLDTFGEAVKGLRTNIRTCPRCFNFTDQEVCVICADPAREASQICVVEESLDVVALEKTKEFKGQYHVLGGTIAPLDGIGPQDLTIDQLITRIHNDKEPVKEVILATNPSLEGEATAMYIIRKVNRPDIRLSRIARGIPVGGELEYADEITLTRALEDRMTVKSPH